MSNKPKREVITSPAGIARWVCVTKPSTKFDDDGIYSVELVLSPEDAEALNERLTKAAAAAQAKAIADEPKKAGLIKKYALNTGISAEVDEEGNETGNFIFKSKAKAKIRPKGKEAFEKRIGLFDSKGKPITGVNIGKGSKLKVAFEVVPFCMHATKTVGVTSRLSAVQIINLVKYVPGGNAESYGFGEEDGYSFDGEEGSMPTDTENASTESGEAAADGTSDF